MTVVSIFVNPLQFDRPDDFDRYPRPIDADVAVCARARRRRRVRPARERHVRAGFRTTVTVGELTPTMEGAARPGHFDGVTTVVTKLFTAVRPDVAVFGEKDFQQLAVVRRLSADLDLGVEVIGLPDGSRTRWPGVVEPEHPPRPGAASGRRVDSCRASTRRSAMPTAASDRRRVITERVQRTLDARARVSRVDYVAMFEPRSLEAIERHRRRSTLPGVRPHRRGRVRRRRAADRQSRPVRALTVDAATRASSAARFTRTVSEPLPNSTASWRRSATPVSTMISTAAVEDRVGDDRRADAAQQHGGRAEGDADTADSTITSPRLPVPRTGSKWAAPKSTPCTTIARITGMQLRRPRITTPRNTISSTIGAAITAVMTSDTM